MDAGGSFEGARPFLKLVDPEAGSELGHGPEADAPPEMTDIELSVDLCGRLVEALCDVSEILVMALLAEGEKQERERVVQRWLGIRTSDLRAGLIGMARTLDLTGHAIDRGAVAPMTKASELWTYAWRRFESGSEGAVPGLEHEAERAMVALLEPLGVGHDPEHGDPLRAAAAFASDDTIGRLFGTAIGCVEEIAWTPFDVAVNVARCLASTTGRGPRLTAALETLVGRLAGVQMPWTVRPRAASARARGRQCLAAAALEPLATAELPLRADIREDLLADVARWYGERPERDGSDLFMDVLPFLFLLVIVVPLVTLHLLTGH